MNVPLHQQQNKCTALVKNKTAAAATTLQLTYPLFTANACSSGGGTSLSQTQSSNNSCSILEAAKHQDIGLPRAFSFCYQQEIESTKQTLGSRNKALPEQVWIKVGEALCKQAINKRNRSRIRQLDTSVERRALGEIQNVGEGATTAPGSWQSAESSQSHLGEQSQSAPGGRSQRRERHNRMERDRRRRIRICCDELNLLVPFCNAETDKATTLQWTTAFLKYIQERHGDSLKKIPNCPLCPGIRRYRVIVSKSSARGVCSSLSKVASAWPAHSMIVEMTGSPSRQAEHLLCVVDWTGRGGLSETGGGSGFALRKPKGIKQRADKCQVNGLDFSASKGRKRDTCVGWVTG
ncbi:PREDICTED: transcription factor-like 5 protein isoform X2 [Myotis brandtii]|uniref:transcription factor-like 5 protein isoform X2 n=1 Tax=Myotis brandtii TaxID=109478 RepID=UPI0007042A5A|nr:PREDICTED: transcription factor-like 5 protein isoform X2 [Myotis brandtii]